MLARKPARWLWQPGAGGWLVVGQQLLASLGGLALLSLFLDSARAVTHAATAALLYILVVLLSAIAFGLIPSLATALVGSALFTYLFIPPYGSLGIHSVEEALRLLTFLIVALLVSSLSSRARQQTRMAALRAGELSALYRLGQALEAQVGLDGMLPTVVRTTMAILAAPGCRVLLYDGEGALLERASSGVFAPGDSLAEAALRADQRALGVIQVAHPPAAELSRGERELLQTIAAHTALVIERVRLSELAGHSRALSESERLKSTLLSLVSHDLRTPLSVIKGLVTSLLDQSVGWTEAMRRELLQTINEETNRLNRIVGELLEMSRIEAGAISQARAWQDLAELLAAAVEHVRPEARGRTIVLDLPEEMPPLRISYAQIEQVLLNLLENALHHTPPGAPIEIAARVEAELVRVEVRDHGPGVPAALREQIFERFVRGAGAERHAGGSGLGLAICKGLIEAHGGRIWAEERPGGGACFAFTLPREPLPAPAIAAPQG